MQYYSKLTAQMDMEFIDVDELYYAGIITNHDIKFIRSRHYKPISKVYKPEIILTKMANHLLRSNKGLFDKMLKILQYHADVTLLHLVSEIQTALDHTMLTGTYV